MAPPCFPRIAQQSPALATIIFLQSKGDPLNPRQTPQFGFLQTHILAKMSDSVQLINHIELYVNTSSTPSQQAASVDAIATLLKNDLLTLEALVREMEMYLTTTDNTIRSSGILLLAEIVEQLSSKPLHSTSIHSLIGFFTQKLEDWKALRGAAVGCLALLRRKNDVGTVTDDEAKAVAQTYLQNVVVQSSGQHDRKICFQLMECLLDRYSGAFEDMADNIMYGICEAIDGEKDPQCLLHVFRIVENLARLYPDPSGPLASFAGELFEILSPYFPIHFTHPKGEDDEVKREELSRALMMALASTPLFEPFFIPLLLEKLSSSLPSAKVESFKCLSYCTTKYGPDRMAKHAEAIWSSIKDTTYVSPQSTLSNESESTGGMSFQESDVTTQAFILLQEVIRQPGDFSGLIIHDNDINMFMNSLIQFKEFDAIPLQAKQRLHAVARILSTGAKASVALCDKVFQSFFTILMGSLGISVEKSSENGYRDEDCVRTVEFNFGALYLCVELLTACRYLTFSLDNCGSAPDFSHQTWCALLSDFSKPLAEAFVSLLRSNIADNASSPYIYFGFKGLQVLATFPESFAPVSKSIYDNILLELLGIVASHSNKMFLWTWALKALVEIGVFIDKCPDTEKAACFDSIVVKKIVSLISCDESALPSSLKLQAAFEIGATRKDFMLRVVQGLDEAIHTKFSHGCQNPESDKLMVKLLDMYSQKVLPWILEAGGSEEIPLNFALSIWDQIENTRSLNLTLPEIATDVIGATMTAMRKAVASCSIESQEIIINKASEVLFSNSVFRSMGYTNGFSTVNDEKLQQIGWLTSLFASVVIPLCPQTNIPNGKVILQLFITSLVNGHVPSAHALGSLVNKLPLEIPETGSSRNFSLNEALDMIFHNFIRSGINSNNLKIESEINTVIGLAWIGKGLLMRGHEKVKDVTMALLSFMTLDGEVSGKEELHKLMICAGDAFGIIMSDSEECLNRTDHAIIRPLYKQRFFSTILPILLSLVVKSESSFGRSMLHRAIAHVLSDTPLTAILGDAKKLVPILLGCLATLSKDILNKEIVYNVLLVVSGILVEKNGRDAAVENAPGIVNQLIELTTFPHKMAIRETALQCLVAVTELPHTRIYPFRAKVLKATLKALDDPKRIVRQEAVRCRQAW
ncbi:mms19 nucleotide excision repair protein homolog [Phtheirospermum japonicum]|uniref:MMS19 nucleotide excision repair protein n=1 Tax=Phtheirospermum japonicum TaxID=374723 RepID=A0A830CDU2_9LAMI|nr:mms19 nucleotide excision repair protein homolog [Phtheirospermum japonicum]